MEKDLLKLFLLQGLLDHFDIEKIEEGIENKDRPYIHLDRNSTRNPVSVEIWGSGRPMREFLANKPDGTPRQLTDPRRLHRPGWRHRVELVEGGTCQWKNIRIIKKV